MKNIVIVILSILCALSLTLWLKSSRQKFKKEKAQKHNKYIMIKRSEYNKLIKENNVLKKKLDKKSHEGRLLLSRNKRLESQLEEYEQLLKRHMPEDIKHMSEQEKRFKLKELIKKIDWEVMARFIIRLQKEGIKGVQPDEKMLEASRIMLECMTIIKKDKKLTDYFIKSTIREFYLNYFKAADINLDEYQQQTLEEILSKLPQTEYNFNPMARKMGLDVLKQKMEGSLSLDEKLKEILTSEQMKKYIKTKGKDFFPEMLYKDITTGSEDVAVKEITTYWVKQFKVPEGLEGQVFQIARDFYAQYNQTRYEYDLTYGSNPGYFINRRLHLELVRYQINAEERLVAILKDSGIKIKKDYSSKIIRITK